jgi:hypothetical protein
MIVERIAPMAIGSSLEKRGSSSRQVVDWWFKKSHIGYPNAFAKTRRNAFRLKFRTASGGTLDLS